jgi:hypothetical protein
MTGEQFTALNVCISAELYGDVSTGPEVHAFYPLRGTAKELVKLGYLNARDYGDVIGLTVTRAGYRAAAN